VAMLLAVGGCDADPAPPPPTPMLPADTHLTWKQARACRSSHEHWLHGVRVVVNDLAWKPYTTWLPYHTDNPTFPVGALVVKPEYDDEKCTELIGYTVMRKEPAGYWPAGHDWSWHELDAKGLVRQSGRLSKACVQCHVQHCAPPNGYDLTCTPD